MELFREAVSDESPLKPVQIKVVLRADVERGAYDKVAVISGNFPTSKVRPVLLF